MMGRKRTVHKNFPPRLKLRGKTYYFDHGLKDGKRHYTALGQDFPLAMRQWAELSGSKPEGNTTFGDAVKRYRRDVLATLAPATQDAYDRQLTRLTKVLGKMALEAVTAQIVRQYFDRRSKRVEIDGKMVGGEHTAAREVAVISTVFNFARQWGYTNAPNPRQGMRLPKAKRDVYVTDDVYSAIYGHADELLKDAMDLAYCTGQRPSDVLRMSRADIRGGELWITPAKTKKSSGQKIRVPIAGELERVLTRIVSRPRLVTSLRLFQHENGDGVTLQVLQRRWVAARTLAGIPAAEAQFRDIRAKTLTDLDDVNHAQKLAAHTTVTTTEGYIKGRLGDRVKPLNRKIR